MGGVRLDAPLLDVLREDLRRHSGQWHRPGFHAVALHRIGVWQRSLPFALRLPVALFSRALYVVVRNVYGIELPRTAIVGRRLLIGHQSGIVVSEIATIGDDCVLRQNVTIGVSEWGEGPAPVIGDRVEIGAGAVILGAIVVGDGAFIGPNAVVTSDVPPGARVVAPAGRVLPPVDHRSPTTAEEDPPAAVGDAAPPVTLERVLDVVGAALGAPPPDPDAALLSSGIVDSLRTAELLDAFEDSFGIHLTLDDLEEASFDTGREMHQLLSRRRST